MNPAGDAIQGFSNDAMGTRNILVDNAFFLKGCVNDKYVGNNMVHEIYI